jgi:hypothetical protein
MKPDPAPKGLNMIMVGRAHRCIPWANAQQLWLTLSMRSPMWLATWLTAHRRS